MKILIAGGSGLVGSHLVPKLEKLGHQVAILTTQKDLATSQPNHYYWDPRSNLLPKEAVIDTDVVINLAGFSVANRWSKTNKLKMIDSRIQSTETLTKAFEHQSRKVSLWIAASASGYYEPGNDLRHEENKSSQDFLGQLTANWEVCNRKIGLLAKRNVIMRIPVILATEDGALKKMLPLYRIGLGAPVGDGDQKMSWIHVHDLVDFIIYGIEHLNVDGTFNLTPSAAVTNAEFSKTLANALGKPHFLPKVPSFLLKLMFGEMSQLVLQGRNLSGDKLRSTGFKAKFTDLSVALNDLLKQK